MAWLKKRLRADAATFAFPRGDLVVYLYNPFRAQIVAAVLDALLALPRREIVILYHTPLEREVIERRGCFTCVADLGFGAVFAVAQRRLPPTLSSKP